MRTPLLIFSAALLLGPLCARAQVQDELAPYVEAYVQGPDSPWSGFAVENLSVEAPRGLSLPAGDLRVELQTRSAAAGSLLLSARIGAPGAATRETWVRVRASLYAEVAVAARPIARGQSLGPDDVRLERRQIQRLTPEPVRGVQELDGMRARRPLAKGAILTSDAVEAVPLVQRGDPIQLVAVRGTLRVSVEAQALEDGVRGKRIRVKNLSSGKVVVAEVSGPREATVQLP
jgi:flagellar basal body P-ring formation protein FlgA